MSANRAALVALGAMLLLATPLVASQPGVTHSAVPAKTTMYAHLSGSQDGIITTQEPPAYYTDSSDIGLVQHSQGCVANPASTLLAEPLHTFYSYPNPSHVQYDVSENSRPRASNARGVGYDVVLQNDSNVEFHWSLASQITTGDGDPDVNQLPSVVPNVVMRATIREGDEISLDRSGYNSGKIIAQGQSDPINLARQFTQSHPHVTHGAVGDQYVYDFSFDLNLAETLIRASEGFNLRVDIFVDNPACNNVQADEYLMPDLIRQHTSDGHRPYFVWQVMNPLSFLELIPSVSGAGLEIRAVINSAWGHYDLSGDGYDNDRLSSMTLMAPDGAEIALTTIDFANYLYNHNAHKHIQGPLEAAWLWEDLSDAEDGVYTLNLTMVNDQQTATLSVIHGFQIGNGELREFATCASSICQASDFSDPIMESPAIGLLMLIAMLAIIARRQ